MIRRAVIVVALLVIGVGCKKKEAPSPPATVDRLGVEGGSIAQPRFGGDPDDQPRVAFVIDAVHAKQSPSASPPWHQAGGEWTFFDAHLTDGTKLGFGILEQDSAGGFAFGKGMLTVPDAENGAKLAKNLASAFHGKLPPANPRGALHITPISIAILGKNRARTGNGFSSAGTWTATKLFLQRPGIEAEVFFNFDLQSRRGELTEKDRDYANDLVAFVASELRDGPPAPRTPENDPQVSAVGPKLDPWRVVASGDARFVRFEDGGKSFVFTVPDGTATRVMSAKTDDPSNAIEITRANDRFAGLTCAGDTCILSESRPAHDANTFGSEDLAIESVVDRKKKTKRAVPLPVEGARLAVGSSLSADGAYVAFYAMKDIPKAEQKGGLVKYSVLHFVSLGGAATTVADDAQHRSLDVAGWIGTGAALRAVLQEGSKYERDQKPTWSLFDPKTGVRTSISEAPPGVSSDESLSPDGKHRVACHDGVIAVTDAKGGGEKRFTIHPDDRRALDGERRCVTWASSRFLGYDAGRRGFIDIETMKLSFLLPPNEEPPPSLSFSPDFAWATSTTKEGLRLARVAVR